MPDDHSATGRPLVHTSPVVTTALRRELRGGPAPVRVETTVHSWTDFRRDWDFAGDVVVIHALLDDHVPLPLKVRALRRLGSVPVVLGPGRETPFARRCGAEGARAWIEPTNGLTTTARTIREVASGRIPEHARPAPAPPCSAELTDRELQVLSLYASTRGHSPAHLGRVLSLRTETVRSHLARGRARYRALGHDTHGRAALRAALVADGWFLDPAVWTAASRA
ncbi:helix-turn-helix transcriptional regulator [Janibacter alittae]|uniref:HTH luxR-type domain-containing protein n=1 Tax=Janibacter alittae TaxID=3115209 RepID=A0ABZ2MJ77_9MICO